LTVAPEVLLTGFASVSASGPVRGLPALASPAEPQPIARWATASPRRAFLVPPFRATDFVPDLRTRRMDRLSVWALLGSALALQDAGIDAEALDRSRTAVVCATAYGCLDLTEEFLGAISTNASQAPPILFPETLANLPGSHLARHFGITGPNLTMSAGHVSGEAALVQAVSLLRAGDADRAIVLAGDTLTRPLFEWYEAASLLAPACFGDASPATAAGRRAIVPGEGLAACLLETGHVAAARRARVHGRYHAGWLGSLHGGSEGPRELEVERVLRQLLGEALPGEVVLVAPAASGPSWMACLAGRPAQRGAAHLRALPGLEFGEFGGSGLLQLGVALARLPQTEHGFVMVAGPADDRVQAAAILMARPEAR
jgi:3-oxoacyl-[acyl-carrier-protein] synthase II